MLKFDLDYSYGNNAKEAYLKCCDRFGWGKRYAYDFGIKKSLYATNATREGYSVWFLANSNWTGTNNGIWQNEIFLERQEILESWAKKRTDLFGDKSTRVVFAKRDIGYVFIGVYEFLDVIKDVWKSDLRDQDGAIIAHEGDEKYIKIYRRKSDCYEPQSYKMTLNKSDFICGHWWLREEYERVFEAFLKVYVFQKKEMTLPMFVTEFCKGIKSDSVMEVVRGMKGIVDDANIPNRASFPRLDDPSEKMRKVTSDVIAKYGLTMFKSEE